MADIAVSYRIRCPEGKRGIIMNRRACIVNKDESLKIHSMKACPEVKT